MSYASTMSMATKWSWSALFYLLAFRLVRRLLARDELPALLSVIDGQESE